jgi:hypothetical protein
MQTTVSVAASGKINRRTRSCSTDGAKTPEVSSQVLVGRMTRPAENTSTAKSAMDTSSPAMVSISPAVGICVKAAIARKLSGTKRVAMMSSPSLVVRSFQR